MQLKHTSESGHRYCLLQHLRRSLAISLRHVAVASRRPLGQIKWCTCQCWSIFSYSFRSFTVVRGSPAIPAIPTSWYDWEPQNARCGIGQGKICRGYLLLCPRSPKGSLRCSPIVTWNNNICRCHLVELNFAIALYKILAYFTFIYYYSCVKIQ